jgi:hypothetical protein
LADKMDLARFSSKCGPCARLETNGRPVAGLSTLEKFYWRDYVKVTVKNLLPDHIIPDIPMLGHKRVYPPIPEHTVVVMGDKLATAETLGPGWKIQRWPMTDRQYTSLLRRWVFGGSVPSRVVRVPLMAGCVIWFVLLILGSRRDINFRRKAAVGIHRRGTKMVSSEEFNRKALGWWPVR